MNNRYYCDCCSNYPNNEQHALQQQPYRQDNQASGLPTFFLGIALLTAVLIAIQGIKPELNTCLQINNEETQSHPSLTYPQN